MSRRLAAALAAVVLGLGVAACSDEGSAEGVSVSSGPTAEAAPQNGATLDAQEFAAALKREGTIILDVRTPEEFAEGHLEGAVSMDVESPDFAAKASALDPTASYAVYCRSGNRSAVAVQALTGAGFASVYHLEGGIQAWEDAGGAVVTS
ncbi:MAG TPA: rhodanese-like domain-containing protein [Nocardioides sp.]|uniref:rhodanese-like domain-containing protein n=1 Tax=Nocardioides sp. TaxID=35761 RepID=UPI002BB8CE5A|nr:rhodanese-like domain-containing protein [Nocardioides sp.]HQR26001.1 rhodanese-like domain-containing protein [Nocardioides sp.]